MRQPENEMRYPQSFGFGGFVLWLGIISVKELKPQHHALRILLPISQPNPVFRLPQSCQIKKLPKGSFLSLNHSLCTRK